MTNPSYFDIRLGYVYIDTGFYRIVSHTKNLLEDTHDYFYVFIPLVNRIKLVLRGYRPVLLYQPMEILFLGYSVT